MKSKFTAGIHKRMTTHDKFYGLTTMGERGQVVIPVEARKDLGLKPGDHLLVLGKYGKAVGLVKADQIRDLVKAVMKNFEHTGLEKDMKEYASKFFGKHLNS